MKCGDVVGFPVVQTTTPLADYKTLTTLAF
jgi:hypothetical protein